MKESLDMAISAVSDIVSLYQQAENTTILSEGLTVKASHFFLKGTSTSQIPILASALYELNPRPNLFVLNDKDAAAYFWNDLQNLLPHQEVLFFPNSYKKPYEFTEIENANIVQRSEALSKISSDKSAPHLIVTYPEALFEKVINQKSLLSNTLTLRKADKIDFSFLTDVLNDYDFNKEDYVYEAGMFSIRGGIIDIYSFSNELPFRIELDGNQIESIRVFDPITQLSVRQLDRCLITPNVQTKLLKEVRESLLKFISGETIVWVKDFELAKNTISQYYDSAKQAFAEILKSSGQTKIVFDPEELFDTGQNFENHLVDFRKVEFGAKPTAPLSKEKSPVFLNQKVEPQPSFDKDFNLFAQELDKNQLYGYKSVITVDSQVQLNRLKNILHEVNPRLDEFSEVLVSLSGGFIDHDLKVALYTDHQLFERFHRYHQRKKYTKSKALTIKELHELQIGDYITHIDYGIGRFAGMEKIQVKGKEQEAMRLIYKDSDVLYVSIHSLHKISKYSGQEGKPPQVSKLGTQEWDLKKSRAKRKLKDIAQELIKLYAKRRIAPGFAFKEDDYLMAELESSFIYDETPDQSIAIEAVKKDMSKPHPMDRLICGDVGFGKTEVAIRAAFKAVTNGKQVAVLVPTTILAFQHFRTFSERLKKLPCKVEYVSRFRSDKEIKDVLDQLSTGKVDIVIGTHRLISKDVIFKNLGLLIIDEEQKFGVKVKDTLKQMRVNVDAITLTATPIPRTLQLSLMGARDLSVIATPPPNRQPISTQLHVYSEKLIRDAIMHELTRGGQTFFVHNRIEELESIANTILKVVPDARVAYAHGQMEGEQLEKIMLKFMDGYYDVLVSTNIIESGLDIANANTIIINKAHHFGLSDLHQMRGRVGRSNRKAYCYLLIPSLTAITPDSRKKLAAMEEFSELGDGFKIAMRDLDIRGAGNLLGGEQSGFISDLGFDVYIKMLEEAVAELKENEFREIFEQDKANQQANSPTSFQTDCSVETDLQIVIPDDYVTNTSERLSLYIQIDSLKSEAEMIQLQTNLKDKYGNLPGPLLELFEIVRLRWKAQDLGIEKLVLKNETMKAQFPDGSKAEYYKSDTFGKVVAYVSKNQKNCRLAEAKGKAIITFSPVLCVEDAQKILTKIL